MRRPILALAATILAAPLAAQQAQAPFTVQETGESFQRLDDAVSSIRMGKGTILIQPGRTLHVAFIAGNPGKWPIESAIPEHRAAGRW